jgi:hypothetical protein
MDYTQWHDYRKYETLKNHWTADVLESNCSYSEVQTQNLSVGTENHTKQC